MREIKFRAWHIKDKKMLGHKDACLTPLFTPSFQYRNGETVLMQYTGLQDKSGKDIYEGDALTMFDGEYLANVKFIRGAFRFIGNGLPFSYYQEHCEVVGNIYEKPELLR